MLVWSQAGLENCTRVPEETPPAWELIPAQLPEHRAQPRALGYPASASLYRSLCNKKKLILFLLLSILITVGRILTEQLHRENTCKRGEKKHRTSLKCLSAWEGLSKSFVRGSGECSCSAFNNNKSITSHSRRWQSSQGLSSSLLALH